MTIAHQIDGLQFKDNMLLLWVDGKSYSFDLKKISAKLLTADDWQRNSYTVSPSGYGIHWTILDEDLSIDGLLKSMEG